MNDCWKIENSASQPSRKIAPVGKSECRDVDGVTRSGRFPRTRGDTGGRRCREPATTARSAKNGRTDRRDVTGRASSGQRNRIPPDQQKRDTAEDHKSHASDEKRSRLGGDCCVLVPV